MRNDFLANELFKVLRIYTNKCHERFCATKIHELLYLSDCYFYLNRETSPERLLAATIYAIQRYQVEENPLPDVEKLDFYKSSLRIIVKHITGNESFSPVPIVQELPLQQNNNVERLLLKILDKLKDNGVIESKKRFCSDIGMNYVEICKGRDSTKNLLMFLCHCQNQKGWWIKFTNLVSRKILLNLNHYFISSHHQRISRAKGIFERVQSS